MRKPSQLIEALEAAFDKKAQDVVAIDVADVCSFTDYFIVCTGTSTRHNETIADSIQQHLKAQGVRPLHIEGRPEGEWILMDYFDLVVHIFTARAREFYDIERLWRAGTRLDLDKLVGPHATKS